ncbi:MAG: ImmA/IrrE family metallo-endopeptidase [Nanopusillaceae archaeon]
MNKKKPILVARSCLSKLGIKFPPVPIEKLVSFANAFVIEGPLDNDGYTFRQKDLERMVFLCEGANSEILKSLREAEKKGLKNKYFILLKSEVPLVRKRFTLAHEIGHIVLKHFERSEFIYFFHKDENHNYFEEEANLFASEVLVPYPFLKQAIFQAKIRDIPSLARLFNVSEQVITIKLKYYNLLDIVVPKLNKRF